MKTTNRDDLKLWAIAGAGFLMLALAYAAFFTIAARTPVQTVPLERRAAP